MDENTQNFDQTLDQACEATFQDPQVAAMYADGLISRTEADVYDIIVDFQ